MSLSTIIIIITGITTYMGFQDHKFFERYAFSVSGIKAGEFYRFITSAFLHSDWMHYLVNMFTLYFFGDFVVAYFGPTTFLLIYFGGVFVGNYLSYYFHKNDLWYKAIGASAGVNAVVYSYVTLQPFDLILVFFIPVPAIIYALGYLWYTTKGTQDAFSRYGHEAHFGGAIAGVVLTIFLDYYQAVQAHPLVTILLLGALAYGFYYMQQRRFIN
jgi:membrane associated rhomboid family serine protease